MQVYLHKSCSELPAKILHPLHPHPLTCSLTDDEILLCDGCRDLYGSGFNFSCSWSCGFNLDAKCASKQDQEYHQTFKELTLFRFYHKHALKLCNVPKFVPGPIRCCCCRQIISTGSSAYCCIECQIIIHESCTEIPMEIHHPFHPQHILLTQAIDEDDYCDACKSSIHGIKLDCNECYFQLHVSCANPNRWASPLKHNCHEHNMFYFVKDDTTGSFECNKCHEKCLDDEAFYRCVECDFNLHFKCIPIPSFVKITQKHHHPLTLIDSVKEDNPLIQYLMDSNDKVDYYCCDECKTPVNPKHHAYCCKECIYIAHVDCIISEVQLSHPSHPHKLTLLQLEPTSSGSSEEKTKYCNGCNEVMSFPDYACNHESAHCKFYLHKSCAELQPNIQHPLHSHPLILDYKIPAVGIICDGCRNLYKKGFTYYCTWCRFNLHPKCASKQDHQELLQQQTFEKLTLYHLRYSNQKYCCCCNKIISGSAYCCLECGFFIHESCSEIPKQVQHPFHPQHRLLAQPMEVKEVQSCNACLLAIRGIKIGCIECRFNLHVSCANPNYRALKHKCHKHNMYYFVDDTIKKFFKCNNCHQKCFEKYYRCVKCDFNLHLECIPMPSVVTVTQKHHHRLTLIDSVKEDNPLIQYLMDSNDKLDYSMDYYCDVCETPGNPKHHAYCCKECIYIAHVECIISKECPPLEIPRYLVPRSRHEAEQDNNIDGEVDESEKESDIEDCSLAQLDEKIAGVKKTMDKLASKLEVLQEKRAQKLHSLS